jgi:hypothetical protein
LSDEEELDVGNSDPLTEDEDDDDLELPAAAIEAAATALLARPIFLSDDEELDEGGLGEDEDNGGLDEELDEDLEDELDELGMVRSVSVTRKANSGPSPLRLSTGFPVQGHHVVGSALDVSAIDNLAVRNLPLESERVLVRPDVLNDIQPARL